MLHDQTIGDLVQQSLGPLSSGKKIWMCKHPSHFNLKISYRVCRKAKDPVPTAGCLFMIVPRG